MKHLIVKSCSEIGRVNKPLTGWILNFYTYGQSGSEPLMRPMPSKLDVLVGNSEHDTQY